MNEQSIGSIHVCSPAPREVWLELLQSDPYSMIFQTPDWTDLICSTGKFEDASRLYQKADGSTWVLPLVRRKSSVPLRMTSQGSFPRNWGYGGTISHCRLCRDEIQTVFADLDRQPVILTRIQPNPLLSAMWEAGRPPSIQATPRISHILNLECGFDSVWSERFNHQTRTNIRKAEHCNLCVEWDSAGKLLPVYYQIYMQWAVRRGRERRLPAWFSRLSNRHRDPLDRFERIARVFGDACRVGVVSCGGEPIAAAIFLIYRENAFAYRATSIKEKANPVRANDLLQWQMIEAACSAGCRWYHLGESGGVASLMRFKSGLGAEAVAFSDYCIERLPVEGTWNLVYRLIKQIETVLINQTRTSVSK